MPHPHPFVGRNAEIKQFTAILADPAPQAILIVGHQGMGKSMLARKFHDMAQPHASTGGGSFVFQVRKDQSIGGILEKVLAEAKQAAHAAFTALRFTAAREAIWLGLSRLIAGGGGREITEVLAGEDSGDRAEKFIRFLTQWGAKLPDASRVLFVFDSDKRMAPEAADSWRSLVEKLPPKFKLVFAQRPNDVLARNDDFNRLETSGKLVRVEIGVLDNNRDPCVAKLVEHRRPPVRENIVRAVFDRYDGHPFAVQAGLDLVADGAAVDTLPTDPTHPTRGIAAEQWRHVADRGDEAKHLLEAYAVLEVPVPDDVVRDIAGIDRDDFERLSTHDDFVSGLLAAADGHRQIYHSLLSEYIVAHVLGDQAKPYHRKAIDLFRQKLKHARETQSAPDPLAAERLAEHVLATDGDDAFVVCFVNECGRPLMTLGRFDAAIDLSDRALVLASGDSVSVAMLSGNQGLIHGTRGDLDKAEEMHRKSLEIQKKLGRLEGMARVYGNLGLIHETRGDLDKAEEMFRKSLEINKKLGRLEGMANQYGNLGLIHQMRGDLNKAEEMLRKAFEIDKKLGLLEGMASRYGNLGLIHKARGDLEQAEEMHRKSLDISEKLGRLEGMANQYGNLGLVAEQRGDLNETRRLWIKARDLFEKIGIPHMVEKHQGWIDSLPANDPQ